MITTPIQESEIRATRLRKGSRVVMEVISVAVISLATTTSNADVITSGTVVPNTLGSIPDTTYQIIVGNYLPGTLSINTDNNVNDVSTTYDGYNGNGGIGMVIGEGTHTEPLALYTNVPTIGTVNVTGNGAGLDSAGSIVLGAAGGIGNLNVSDGAFVDAYQAHTYSSAGIYVGWDNNSAGNLTVDSNGFVSSADLQIGFGANSAGTMTISNGGYVDQSPNYTIDQNAFTDYTGIGFGNNATGSVTVTGTYSVLSTTGLGVGSSHVGGTTTNQGTLNILDGGQVFVDTLGNGKAGGAYVGSAQGSQVTIGGFNTTSGVNSTLVVGAITDTTNPNYGHELNIGGYGAGTVTVQQGGVIDATGANIRVGASDTYSDPGTLIVQQGGTVYANNVTVNTNGLLGGDGTINANVTVNGGTVSPGDPVTMTINGDLIFTDGILDIQLAGANDFDKIIVSGNADLTGGTIQFDFLNGFLPTADDSFDFLSASNLNIGSAVNFSFLGLPAGTQFSIDNSLGSLTLTPSTVPVPAAAWLFGSGLLGLIGVARPSKKGSAPPRYHKVRRTPAASAA